MKRNLLLMTLAAIFIGMPMLKAQDDEAKKAAEAAMSTTVKSNEIKDTAKNWKFSGMVGLNATQTQFWNWAAGGNNNVTGVVYANMTLSYKKNKLAWDSNLDTEIGELYSADLNPRWRKSNDKFNIYSKLGYELAKNWYLTALGSFKTQFAPGYEYANNDAGDKTLIAKWASPSYTDLSIGVDWKPNDIFSVYLSPVAGRMTTATDSLLRERYGVPLNKSLKVEVGLTFKAAVTYTKIKNLKILSSLTLFTPYTKEFGNFNVDWDFMISYQFLKVLNVSLTTALKYYDEVMITDKNGNVGPRIQFKEVLGLGVGYSF